MKLPQIRRTETQNKSNNLPSGKQDSNPSLFNVQNQCLSIILPGFSLAKPSLDFPIRSHVHVLVNMNLRVNNPTSCYRDHWSDSYEINSFMCTKPYRAGALKLWVLNYGSMNLDGKKFTSLSSLTCKWSSTSFISECRQHTTMSRTVTSFSNKSKSFTS